MDDGENDYDRIAKQIGEIVRIVWSTAEVMDREMDVAKNLGVPALQFATQKLNRLQDWVVGLSEVHRAAKDE